MRRRSESKKGKDPVEAKLAARRPPPKIIIPPDTTEVDEERQLLFCEVASRSGYPYVEEWFKTTARNLITSSDDHRSIHTVMETSQIPAEFRKIEVVRQARQTGKDLMLAKLEEAHRAEEEHHRKGRKFLHVFTSNATSYLQILEKLEEKLLDRRRKAEEWTVLGAREEALERIARFERKRQELAERAMQEEAKEIFSRERESARLKMALQDCMEELRDVVSWHVQQPNRGQQVAGLRQRQLLEILGGKAHLLEYCERKRKGRSSTPPTNNVSGEAAAVSSVASSPGRIASEVAAVRAVGHSSSEELLEHLFPPAPEDQRLKAEEQRLQAQLRSFLRKKKQRDNADRGSATPRQEESGVLHEEAAPFWPANAMRLPAATTPPEDGEASSPQTCEVEEEQNAGNTAALSVSLRAGSDAHHHLSPAGRRSRGSGRRGPSSGSLSPSHSVSVSGMKASPARSPATADTAGDDVASICPVSAMDRLQKVFHGVDRQLKRPNSQGDGAASPSTTSGRASQRLSARGRRRRPTESPAGSFKASSPLMREDEAAPTSHRGHAARPPLSPSRQQTAASQASVSRSRLHEKRSAEATAPSTSSLPALVDAHVPPPSHCTPEDSMAAVSLPPLTGPSSPAHEAANVSEPPADELHVEAMNEEAVLQQQQEQEEEVVAGDAMDPSRGTSPSPLAGASLLGQTQPPKRTTEEEEDEARQHTRSPSPRKKRVGFSGAKAIPSSAAIPGAMSPAASVDGSTRAGLSPRLKAPYVPEYPRMKRKPPMPPVVMPPNMGGPTGAHFTVEQLGQLVAALRSEADGVNGLVESTTTSSTALLAQLQQLKSETAQTMLANVQLEKERQVLLFRQREEGKRSQAQEEEEVLAHEAAVQAQANALQWRILRDEQQGVLADLSTTLEARQRDLMQAKEQVLELQEKVRLQDALLTTVSKYWRSNVSAFKRASSPLSRPGSRTNPASFNRSHGRLNEDGEHTAPMPLGGLEESEELPSGPFTRATEESGLCSPPPLLGAVTAPASAAECLLDRSEAARIAVAPDGRSATSCQQSSGTGDAPSESLGSSDLLLLDETSRGVAPRLTPEATDGTVRFLPTPPHRNVVGEASPALDYEPGEGHGWSIADAEEIVEGVQLLQLNTASEVAEFIYSLFEHA